MLDQQTRTAILRLHQAGHSIRSIAKLVGVSRNAVRSVIRTGSAQVPHLEREEELGEHLERIREVYATCEGNRIRVLEELSAAGIEVAYSTLTHFCRRHGIGVRKKKRAGRYHFEPGEEMQHDTSPHSVKVAGKRRRVECASLVLCYSRTLYAKVYPRWRRFDCKCFLTEALTYFGGSASRCMLDNSTVIIARGTGPDAEPAAEMAVFAKRFGFRFVAHAVGDANRSARVERPFSYIERNFYAGRTFENLADLNEQLHAWCEKVNRRPKRELEGTPIERLVTERTALSPLPPYVPEVYEVHTRRVDVEGYVSLHTNRYSAPTEHIGRQLEVREGAETIRVFDGPRLVTEHEVLEPGLERRATLPEHRGDRRWKRKPPQPLPEESVLRRAAPEFESLLGELKKRHGTRRSVRHLFRIYMDYPLEAILPALRNALAYGLTDLNRLERMILRQVQGDFFRLPGEETRDG